MRESLAEYCSARGRNELLEQWHPEKNGILTPEAVSYGSQKKVWWRCPEGHEWQSPAYARAGKNCGCPYCAGKLITHGRDLQSLYPDIAAQWHSTKNGGFSPSQFLPSSHKSVWWRCGHGHEWKALIKSRVDGKGCPVCAGKAVIPGENDLASRSPLLASQWHPMKNGPLLPSQVLCGSSRRVWWRCEQGHEWQAEIQSRSAGNGCPVCSGKTIVPGLNDLKSCAPALAAQWLQEKNGSLSPDRVSVCSNKRVWWRCDMGHEWQSAVSARSSGRSGCPYCAGRRVLEGFNDLKTTEPLVAAQWHPTLNEGLLPTMVTAGSRKKVWWKCSDGHEWKAVIYSRAGARKCGCPVCAGRPAVTR